MSVVIIDPATGGVAGLYLHAYRAMADKHGAQLIGAYSAIPPVPLPYFYRRTDLAAGARERFGRLRMPIRYFELALGLFRSLAFIVRRRPKAVFYALSTNLVPELLFVIALRLLGVRVFVICHDVVPFVSAYESRTLKDLQRRQFYHAADVLICHNLRSATELKLSYGIAQEKIIYLPFPILDLRAAEASLCEPQSAVRLRQQRLRFLFIGHVRREKGINILIEAWQQVAVKHGCVELVIAGQVAAGVTLSTRTAPNMTIVDRYIGETEFIDLIKRSDVVILPYISGTNSGILSSVISLGRPAIVSDIEMFRESGLSSSEWMFEAGNANALACRIERFIADSALKVEDKCREAISIRDHRIAEFDLELDSLFKKISNNEL